MIGVISAAADGELTTSEISDAMWGVFNSALFGAIMVFSTKMFIETINPPKKIAQELTEMAEVF